MITKPSDHLENDSRFKSWGKLVTATDVDLTASNGYSLQGQWVKWGESVSLTPGRFLVVAAETGSRANHGYTYRLIGGDGERIPQKDVINPALDAALAEGRVTEDQRAKAANSTLYAYALYISLQS